MKKKKPALFGEEVDWVATFWEAFLDGLTMRAVWDVDFDIPIRYKKR